MPIQSTDLLTQFHPDLRPYIRWIPRTMVEARRLGTVRSMMNLAKLFKPHAADVSVTDQFIPGLAGDPEVRVRIYRSKSIATPAPALLWIHGGGYVIGAPEGDEHMGIGFAQDLATDGLPGVLVVSVDYRLAPENPFPAPLDDCYAAYCWLCTEAEALGIDPARIAIGGASAGGGLAAALTQRACDHGPLRPIFQLLTYPMLDDHTALRTDIDGTYHRLWDQSSNVFGWTAYLGQAPGAANLPEYAVPARRTDLSNLPPTWIGVGTLDLFYDEDIDYARRLEDSGVPCELKIVHGAFHGFDAVARETQVVKDFWVERVKVLRKALESFTPHSVP